MPDLETCMNAIDPADPVAFLRVAVAIEPLDNKAASQVIREWMSGHPQHFRGRWREISDAIWAERQKLREHRRRSRNRPFVANVA
jgi:hypothetical protein